MSAGTRFGTYTSFNLVRYLARKSVRSVHVARGFAELSFCYCVRPVGGRTKTLLETFELIFFSKAPQLLKTSFGKPIGTTILCDWQTLAHGLSLFYRIFFYSHPNPLSSAQHEMPVWWYQIWFFAMCLHDAYSGFATTLTESCKIHNTIVYGFSSTAAEVASFGQGLETLSFIKITTEQGCRLLHLIQTVNHVLRILKRFKVPWTSLVFLLHGAPYRWCVWSFWVIPHRERSPARLALIRIL